MTITDQLNSMRMMIMYYEERGKKLSAPYNLTTTEFHIISFLTNNPTMDTAKDIEELRRIPKATISIAIDSLITKKLITKKEDKDDRRRYHLALTAKAKDIQQVIYDLQKELMEIIFKDFNQEEVNAYWAFAARIMNNIETSFKELQDGTKK